MLLDKTKPYGVVINHPMAFYEQNGVLFDVNGKKLEEVKEKRPYNKRKP